MRILIVEDEIKIRRGLANLIEKHTEHTVAGEARNGKEGLEMVEKYCPDLVLSDIRMPVMDGLEMIRVIYERELCPHCVILSGYSEFEYARQALKYGVDDYLIKPIAPEDVDSVLERMQEKIEKELRQQTGEPEKLIRDALLSEEPETVSWQEIRLACGFVKQAGYRLLAAYTGKASQESRRLCREWFERRRDRYTEQKLYFFFLDSEREFICLLEDDGREEPERELTERLLRHAPRRTGWVWAQSSFPDFSELAAVHRRMKEIYPYGLVLGEERILTQEGEKQVYEQLLKLQPIQAVSLAVTRNELQECMEAVFQTLVSCMNRKEDIGNYTINRAIRYIRNHYRESISLELVADSLEITPEYLSTLFNREMGENFSVFLKKFRISHAKRLLKGTDKKIYEIAQEVGYADPKYFNRVFKEEEGVTPKDFRGLL